MKNIERPEVQKSIAFDVATCFANTGESLIAHAMNNKESRILPSKVFKWLNSEYTEPHKWEPWELEFLKHTNKKYLWVAISGNSYVWLYTDKPHKSVSTDNYIGQSYTDTQTKFDTLKQDEVINIDEELERNGMKRE